MRPFLFLSGEYHVTQPAVFRRDKCNQELIEMKVHASNFDKERCKNVKCGLMMNAKLMCKPIPNLFQ